MIDRLTAHTMILLLDAEIERGGHDPLCLRDLEQARAEWRGRLHQAHALNEALAPFMNSPS